MDRREAASLGGKTAHAKGTARKWTPEEARKYAKIGGAKVAENRALMLENARKGGLATAQKPGHMAEIGRRGGQAVAKIPGRMSQVSYQRWVCVEPKLRLSLGEAEVELLFAARNWRARQPGSPDHTAASYKLIDAVDNYNEAKRNFDEEYDRTHQ